MHTCLQVIRTIVDILNSVRNLHQNEYLRILLFDAHYKMITILLTIIVYFIRTLFVT